MVVLDTQIRAHTAIVHDWLAVIGGAERVVADMVECCSDAEIFTVFDFLSAADRQHLVGEIPVHVSGLNALPLVKAYYRNLLLAATRAIEAFDVSKFELVISSSAAIAKGVVTTTKQQHIAYTHATTRYAWDLTHDYLGLIQGATAPLRRMFARELLHRYRLWDMRTIASVDHFIANSKFTQDRIWKYYRRQSEVIYPPVDVDQFKVADTPRQDYYVTLSRAVPYKQIPLIVEAFAKRPDRRLIVMGNGPELDRIRASAPHNVEILGFQPRECVIQHLQRCRAFIFAAVEDFGIAPVEAQACGTPVIAYNGGGAAETIRGLNQTRPTGVLFNDQTLPALLKAIDKFEEAVSSISPIDCRTQAEQFSRQRFRKQFSTHVSELTSRPTQELELAI